MSIEDKLREILSQAHNLPRTGTADRIATLAEETLRLYVGEREPDAYLVIAIAPKGEITKVAFRRKEDAEQDAHEWRIANRKTEVLPLYLELSRISK